VFQGPGSVCMRLVERVSHLGGRERGRRAFLGVCSINSSGFVLFGGKYMGRAGGTYLCSRVNHHLPHLAFVRVVAGSNVDYDGHVFDQGHAIRMTVEIGGDYLCTWIAALQTVARSLRVHCEAEVLPFFEEWKEGTGLSAACAGYEESVCGGVCWHDGVLDGEG
jgi:hypothetical protein